MEICECKICSKEGIKNLGVHLKKSHDTTMKEYKEMFPENAEKVEKNTIENVDDIEKITEPKKEVIEVLDDFLSEYKITREELVKIVRNFKYGENIPAIQLVKRDTEIGSLGAKDLKDQDRVETTNLHIAESLRVEHGFKLLEVTTRGGTIKKTWILRQK